MSDISPPPPRSDPTSDHDLADTSNALNALPDGARAFWFLGESDGNSQELIVLVTCSGEMSEVLPSLDTIRKAVSRNVSAFLTSVNDMFLLFGEEAFNRAQNQYNIELPEEMRPRSGERMHCIMARCFIDNLPAYLNPQSLPLGSDGR